MCILKYQTCLHPFWLKLLKKLFCKYLQYKTDVINDPLGQTHSHASSEHCFLLFCFSRFEKWGRTYGRTTRTKTVIPTGRDFGLAEWINYEQIIAKATLTYSPRNWMDSNFLTFCSFVFRFKKSWDISLMTFSLLLHWYKPTIYYFQLLLCVNWKNRIWRTANLSFWRQERGWC